MRRLVSIDGVGLRMTSEIFTKLGSAVFTWTPLISCTPSTRWLWISLYTNARRVIPGLWSSGLASIADAAKLTPDVALDSLDELIDKDLVEFDRHREVLRLTEFPDRQEKPMGPSHLQSWWTQFKRVPECPVKHAHVRTIEWLLSDPVKVPTPATVKQWEQTFGTIAVPPPRRRGVRRLVDSDTGTDVQTSLFTKPPENVIQTRKSDTLWSQGLINDQRSRISSSLSEESEGRADHETGERIPLLVPVPAMDDLPFAVSEMVEEIAIGSAGRFAASPLDGRLVEPLCATIRACEKAAVGLPDLRVVGEWLAAGGLGYRSDLGPRWLCTPGALLDAVGLARAWVAGGRKSVSGARSPARPGRVDPAPLGAHGTGKRTL